MAIASRRDASSADSPRGFENHRELCKDWCYDPYRGRSAFDDVCTGDVAADQRSSRRCPPRLIATTPPGSVLATRSVRRAADGLIMKLTKYDANSIVDPSFFTLFELI